MPTPIRQPVIIKKEYTRLPHNGSAPQKSPKGPKLLTALLSIIALLALVHFLIMMRTSNMHALPAATCASLVKNSDYTKYVPFDAGSQQIEAIQYVDQLMGGQPAALVQVMDTQHTLDVYIYGCNMHATAPALTVLFKQQGLIQGTVSVSKANTLVLGERDTTLSPETTAIIQPMQQNIYQEYSWQNSVFVQTRFPGLYPVTSRSEAEALQEQANNGQSLPWNDPQNTATQMAKDILQWSSDQYQESLLDNNGTLAHVLLEKQHPHIALTVTLTRLLQKDAKGLWFVTNAQTQGITLDQAHLSAPVTSPITIHGTVTTTLDGQAEATLFDHTITAVSSLNNATLTLTAEGTYSGNLLYTDTKQTQQGLLLIENIPPGGSSEAGQILLTAVILG